MQSTLRLAAIDTDRTPTKVTADADSTAGAHALRRLTDGQWEMVDWFDQEDRRVILIRKVRTRPVVTRVVGPGEYEVAGSAALGETGKQICYSLGLSPSRVSRSVRSLMRKLKVRTHAELVLQIRCLGHTALDASPEPEARAS